MVTKGINFVAGVTGMVFAFAGPSAPSGFLLCDGSVKNRADFPALFGVIGTAYNTGGETGTQFRVPDLRGRVPAGADNMGGTAAGRLTNTGVGNPGINGSTIGAAGGTDRHTLSTPQIPSHTHPLKYQTATFTSGAGVMPQTFGTGTQANTDATGGGEAHPNVQPTIVLNYIIAT